MSDTQIEAAAYERKSEGKKEQEICAFNESKVQDSRPGLSKIPIISEGDTIPFKFYSS